MGTRHHNRLERLVIACAIAIRGVAWWSIEQTGHARHPLVDAYTYWAQAKTLAAGKVAFPDGFYQPPGYPYLLSWIQQIAGTDALWVVRFFQLGLGVLTTWLLILLGRRLGGHIGAPWAGAAAGALYSFYPTTVLFEMELLTPAVTAAALVGAMVLVLNGVRTPMRCAAAGALLGLAATVHPTLLVAAVVLVVWLWVAEQESMRPALAAGVGLVFGLMPIAQANLTQFKRLSVTSNNAGINFYMGNNPDWRDTSFLRPGLRFRKLALESEPHLRDGFARDDYWMSRAWSEIAAEPGAWLDALSTKTIWSLSDVEIPRNEDFRCRTQSGPLSWMGIRLVRYGLVLPFALLGAVRLWRRREDGRLVGLLWVALHVPVIAFIVSDRYRLASWPLLCLAAPIGLWSLIQSVRAWKTEGERPRWISLSWILVCVVPWLPLDERTDMKPGWCAHIEANLAYMEKDLDGAEALYREAIEHEPDDLSAHNWLARTLQRRGSIQEAIGHVDVILEQFPDHFPTLRFMSGLQRRSGNVDAAADLMVRAYRVPGERTPSGVQAVKLLMEAGREEEARALMAEDERLARHPRLRGP